MRVDLLDGCGAACTDFAAGLHAVLNDGRHTWPCAILALPTADTFLEYLASHRTARKRSERASRRGYGFGVIQREYHSDEIHEINTSLERRQGRPMTQAYKTRQEQSPLPSYPCQRHRVTSYGVVDIDGVLRAYASIYRCGEVVNVSQILGHGAHLRDEIMYLMLLSIIEAEMHGGGWIYYSQYDSGTEGLTFFKDRFGFAPERVEWTLA